MMIFKAPQKAQKPDFVHTHTHTHTQVRFAERGRSLVEILGTLSIMGILSLVGLKMYHSAVNSHRANELIYEANKRATMVAAQVMAGRSGDQLSIAEFTDPAGYEFGVGANPKNANQFNITLTGVSEEVCQKMKNLVGEGTVVRVISDDCDELTFNNDLSRGSEAQCQAEGKIWCAATGYCSNTSDCCLSGDCTAGECPEGAATSSTGGSTGIFVTENGTQKECKCGAGSVYVNGACETKPTKCASWTQNECGKGYYCKFTYTAANNLNPDLNGTINTTEQACYVGIDYVNDEPQGTCTAITEVAQPTSEEMKILRRAGFKATFLKGPNLNWWSASSWCVAHGKHLMDVKDMGCYRKGNNKLVEKGQTYTYCCKEGQSCQQSSWNTDQTNALWNGKEILPGKETEVAKFADKMVALRKVYGATYFWTLSPYGNTSENSCYAFYVNVAYGDVGSNLRYGNSFALCE